MQLLDDAPDDDEDGSEVESEDEDDDNQWGDTQSHSANDAELGGDEEESQSDDDESPEGGFSLSNGHQTIQRSQDDLLADEDEPDDGMPCFYRISTCLCPAIRAIHT